MAYNDVGPGYFRTMKTAILQGREFYDTERDRSVCVLNQSAAAYLFPHQRAIGQYVRSTPGATANPAGRGVLPQNVICRVIGLAQDAKFANLQDAPPRTVYFPVTLETITGAGNLVFLMNAPTKAQAIAAYRAAKSALSPATSFVVFVTLREQMEAALGSQRALSLMSGFFAALALLLSGLGLYGMLSSSVAQRTGEIGVRMALGAKRGGVLRMILSEALVLLAAGLVPGAIGLVIAAGSSKMLTGSAFDPIRLAATPGSACLSRLSPAVASFARRIHRPTGTAPSSAADPVSCARRWPEQADRSRQRRSATNVVRSCHHALRKSPSRKPPSVAVPSTGPRNAYLRRPAQFCGRRQTVSRI
jgi:hypothetical protein